MEQQGMLLKHYIEIKGRLVQQQQQLKYICQHISGAEDAPETPPAAGQPLPQTTHTPVMPETVTPAARVALLVRGLVGLLVVTNNLSNNNPTNNQQPTFVAALLPGHPP